MRAWLGLVMVLLCCALGPKPGGAFALADPVDIVEPDGTVLKANLYRPATPSDQPAIVLLHGCAGFYPKRDNPWRDLFVSHGHIVLMPNSFTSRGLGPQCREAKRKVDSFTVRRDDAIASVTWLLAQPGTPPGGVILMGWSDGASTTLAAAAKLPSSEVRGLIAFYPGCAVARRDPNWKPPAPMLILMGEADDWTPAKPCREVADRFAPEQLTMITYPGAYHDFDAPEPVSILRNIPFSQNADKTVHVGNNPEAQADAFKRVPAFIDALLPAGP